MSTRARGFCRLDAVGVGVAGLWCAWVVVATAWAGRPVGPALPYLVPALVAVAGVALGRQVARRADHWGVAALLLAIGLFFCLGWLITAAPGKLPTKYPNANAAVGVQLIALSSLAWLHQRPRARRGEPPLPPASATPPPAPSGAGGLRWVDPLRSRARWLAPAALLGALGVVAVNASTAATAVAGVVLLACLLAVGSRTGPWRWLTFIAGGAGLAAAAYAQVTLARQSVWPDAVVAALSRVRKQLWSEALGLWARHPVTGGGAGSFRETNQLSVDPDLARAHSSVLQVGSEFGFIGLAIFGLFLLVGLLLAWRGDRASALIATAAWVGLGVHSTMDHLYEFVAVTLAGTVVLGWVSAAHRDARGLPANPQPDGRIPSPEAATRSPKPTRRGCHPIRSGDTCRSRSGHPRP